MHTPQPTKQVDAWAATQVLTNMATRVMGSEEYLGRDAPAVGTKVGDHAYELFATCAPAEALQLQFEAHQPTFIALHDLGTVQAARFLAELAAALKLPLQTLTVRRQGFGVTLASLRFIELPSPKAAPLRLYTTASAAEGDNTNRHQVANVLLAFSRMAVVLVGGVAPHAVAAQFAPLRERLLAVPWQNQQLLLVPVAAPSAELTEQARKLVAGTLVKASVTPLAGDTAGRWGFIHGAWSRLRNNLPETTLHFDAPPAEPQPPVAVAVTPTAAALPMRPMPPTFAAAATAGGAGGAPQLEPYAKACSMLKGGIACCVFDIEQRRPVAHAGRRIDSSTLAAQGANLLRAALDAGPRLGDTAGTAECLITLEQQLLFVRQLPQQRRLGMLAVFDRAVANPMVLRMQLQRIEPLLEGK
jgi:hypothetical protein